MTVLVTGASGFVGAQVVRQLVESDQEVVALVRATSSRRRLDGIADRVKFIEADLDDTGDLAARLKQLKPAACIHAAWYAEPGQYLPSPRNLDSLRSSLTLLEELALAGCKHVVGVGTCFEYDMGVQPLREDFRLLAGKAVLSCRWLRGGSLPEDPKRLRFTLGFSPPPTRIKSATVIFVVSG